MPDNLTAAVGKIMHLSLWICVVVRINYTLFYNRVSYSCALDFVLNFNFTHLNKQAPQVVKLRETLIFRILSRPGPIEIWRNKLTVNLINL